MMVGGSKVGGRKWGSLARSFASWNQSITFLVVVCIRYSESCCNLRQEFQGKKWATSIFTYFNQPVTINNITTVTCAWHKKSSHMHIPWRRSVCSNSAFFSPNFASIKVQFPWFRTHFLILAKSKNPYKSLKIIRLHTREIWLMIFHEI